MHHIDTPLQPQDLTAFNITSRSIALQWIEPHDNNAPVTSYDIMYTDPPFLGGEVRTVGSTEEMVVVSGLHPGVEYTFTVVAINEEGTSAASDEVIATTLEEGNEIMVIYSDCVLYSVSIVPSNSPQNITATVVSSTEIEVSWEEVPAIDQNGMITVYEVQYVPLETCNGSISLLNTTTTMLNTTLTDLEEYVEYDITVRAYTSVGPGPYSDPPITERTDEDGRTFSILYANV